MGRKTKPADEGGAPAWMTTFADMMSLLLTFFVLLLSFATMDIVKFRDAMGSINGALGFMQSQSAIFQHSPNAAFVEKQAPSAVPQSKSKILVKDLEEFIIQNKLQEDAETEESERGVILRIRGRMFFQPHMAELKHESQPVFEKISELMKKFPGSLSIEGHTDNIPIREGEFSSKWELSAARAYSSLKFLQEKEAVDSRRIRIAGLGDIHPLAPNDTPEGRAKNSRVEFIFHEK
jgi:chemotaxis protein MotB